MLPSVKPVQRVKRIFLPENVSDDLAVENDPYILARKQAELFPPIPPAAKGNDEPLADLLEHLGFNTLPEMIDRGEKLVKGLHADYVVISRGLEPLSDEAERVLKLHNSICSQPYQSLMSRDQVFQSVVLKKIQIEQDGTVKPIKNDNDGATDVITLDETGVEIPAQDRKEKETSKANQTNGNPKEKRIFDGFPIEMDPVLDEDVSFHTNRKVVGPITDSNYVLAPTPKILPRMIPAVGKKVYAMAGSSLERWIPAHVLDVTRNMFNAQMEFLVEFEGTKQKKKMSGKHLAFSLKTPFVLPVGARVIARFRDELKPTALPDFYAGIVADKPSLTNNFRYLIFFDDGFAQYASVEHVLWICESSRNVWADVHPNSQNFMKEYIQKYPEIPKVKLSQGQMISTEWNGMWYIARVMEVDCDLIKVYFDVDRRYEWIFRGSTRFRPLFLQSNKGAEKDMLKENSPRQTSTSGYRRRRIAASQPEHQPESSLPNTEKSDKPTARKSTTPRLPFGVPVPQPSLNRGLTAYGRKPMGVTSIKSNLEYEGKMTRVLIPKDIPGPKKFILHACKPTCVRPFKEDDPQIKVINPLALPMYYGWDREVAKSPRRTIFYRAPCGRRIRDYEELHQYLTMTKYNMGIDHFCFDHAVDCFNEFAPNSHHFLILDMTYGKEQVPVQCCNTLDHDYPEFVDYTKDRIPKGGVEINLDPEFLSCCDCTDDCSDKEKCACWKMTLAGCNMAKHAEEFNLEVGYQNRRLMDHCITGIYECNSRCQCKKTCLNRVVQFNMKWQLQVFKTSSKGWAIRPLHDIPQGAFICIYAGQLLTDHGANEDGKAFGDEYLAELDYIEVCETYKEGYEAEVVEPANPRRRRRSNDSDQAYDATKDEDYLAEEDGEIICVDENQGDTPYSYSLRRGKRSEDERDEAKKRKISTRELFGPDEMCYIMDAKTAGNIGRYLNHSCQPNVFVQNVFVDTHDLRFPWVAFFAYKHIRAGTELTWDYNYDIGSVPGKTMYCYCGTPECRGRLL